MTTSRHPVQVIVAYDFSPSAEEALGRAIDVAARAPHHVLHIVAVIEHHTHVETADEIREAIKDRVAAAFAGRETASEVQFFAHARIGKPAAEIVDLAAEVGADLIFIGSHGKTGIQRFFLGSVSERVVREAKCPVMVVRQKKYADVDLMHVISYEHAQAPHRAPHRYSYSNRQVLLRPNDWPIS